MLMTTCCDILCYCIINNIVLKRSPMFECIVVVIKSHDLAAIVNVHEPLFRKFFFLL